MAESFGVDAERYDRARPRYPQAAIDQILAACPGQSILAVGCGTGIDARQFRAAGATVLGIEPDPRMAAFARTTGIHVEVSTFEDWDPAGRTFDAVTAATTWHWVDAERGTAKAAQVLRPGGRVALLWNVGDPPAVIQASLTEVIHRFVPGAPPAAPPGQKVIDGYARILDAAAAAITASADFGDPHQWRVGWDHDYTRDEWLDALPTQGVFTRLTADQLVEVSAEIGSAIDSLGGRFTMHYTTAVVTAARR
jgi:SAM-dependent methyltransferase